MYNYNVNMKCRTIIFGGKRIMKNNRLFTLPLALGSILCFSASILLSRGDVQVSAADVPAQSFDGEAQVDATKLSVSASTATTTGNSTSYNIVFSTGAKVLIDVNTSFTVCGTNDELVSYDEEIGALSLEERKAKQARIKAGEEETKKFECYVYSVENSENVVLGQTISRGTYNKDAFYTADIVEIGEYVLTSASTTKFLSIPKSIKTIHANSFASSNLEKIYVNCSEAEKPAGWETGWNGGAEVIWDSDIYSGDYSTYKNAQTNKTKLVGDDTVNYIIGYIPNDPEATAYPLTFEYKFVGETESRFIVNNKKNQFDEYDGVGKGMGGEAGLSNTVSLIIDDIPADKEIDFDSIVIHNIFSATQKEEYNKVTINDEETFLEYKKISYGEKMFKFDGLNYVEVSEYDPSISEYYWLYKYWTIVPSERWYAKPTQKFKRVYSINEFLTFNYKDTTIFNGYTCINVDSQIVDGGIIYNALKPSTYKTYEAKIKAGVAYIRYRFTSLKNSKYRMAYNGQDIKARVDTPISQFILSKKGNSTLSFLFKDNMFVNNFNINNLTRFGLSDVVITIDIVDNDVIVPRSSTSTTFGTIYFQNETNPSVVKNLNTVVILVAAIYSAVAIAVIIVLFFVYKRIYKNDEFKRLKPKQYIRKGITYWLCSLELVLMILFIVLRSVAFNNSIVVYNPFDIFITFFGIAGIIIIGYFIRNLVVYIKTQKKAKKDKKLGVDKDVAMDGTN